MVVVRNCDLGDFAPVLVFLYFFFLSSFFTATKFKSREQWEFFFFFKKHNLLWSNISVENTELL